MKTGTVITTPEGTFTIAAAGFKVDEIKDVVDCWVKTGEERGNYYERLLDGSFSKTDWLIPDP